MVNSGHMAEKLNKEVKDYNSGYTVTPGIRLYNTRVRVIFLFRAAFYTSFPNLLTFSDLVELH